MTSTGLLKQSSQDLWKRAIDSLRIENRSSIDFNGPNKLKIVQEVQALTEKSRDECIGKRWRYVRKNGESVMLIDLFSKVIKWLDHFKQIGDIVVQYDPGHAALPWAGVRFLLQVAINDSRKFAFLVDGASSIAEIVCRCTLLEKFYLQSTSVAIDELENSLVELYACIILYLSKAKSYFHENTAKRIMKSAIFLQSDFESSLNAIFAAQEKVGRYSKLVERQEQIINYKELTLLREAFDAPLKHLTKSLGSVHDSLKETKLREIYDWLSPLTGIFEKKQQDIFNLQSRQDGLGKWLQGTEEFQQWLDGTGERLCCYGKPGVGKTVLSSITIAYLERTLRASGIGIAYIYFDYSQAPILTVANLMASLLYQLLQTKNNLQRELASLYDEHRKKKTRPLLEELTGLLQSAINHCPKVYIVIDALDECPETGNVREDFLDAMSRLDRASILVTSRPISIERLLPGARCLNIQAVDKDIEQYIDERASKSNRIKNFLRKDPGLIETIKTIIVEKSRGMFLLAYLHIESLVTKNDLRSLRDVLHSLPKRLDLTYDSIMERIQVQDDDSRTLATKVLSWIIHTTRPLTPSELCTALAIRPRDRYFDAEGIVEADRLLEICAGIVSIQRESNTVTLVHYTAEEYFRGKGDRYFPEAQAQITDTCLTYLMFDSFREGPCESDEAVEERLQKHCFLEYAAKNWGVHFCKDPKQLARSLVLAFFEESSKVSSSIQVIYKNLCRPQSDQIARHKAFQESQNRSNSTHCLWLAAYFDLTEAIQTLLKNGTNVSIKTGYGETALHAAARRGNNNALNQLLEAGGDINETNECLNRPLSIAASYLRSTEGDSLRYRDMIHLLIEEGAEVAFQDDASWTPLHSASSNGHVDVVKVLLENGSDVNVGDNEGWTPLRLASSRGHVDVVMVLLENGSDVNVGDDKGWTSLHTASSNGQVNVVKVLLRAGADTTIANNDGWTPLNSACDSGHIDVVKVLLEAGADITIANNDGWTPLTSSSRNGHVDIVRVLFEKRAEVTIGAPGKSGPVTEFTPMIMAAEKGHESVVNALFKFHDLPHFTHDTLGNLLHASAYGGCFSVLRFLIEKSTVAYDQTDSQGRNAAHFAARGGHLDILEYLLARGMRASSLDIQGNGLLHYAASGASFDVVQRTIAFYNPTPEHGNNWSPLHWACRSGSAAVINLLLENGFHESVVTTTDPDTSWSPYSIAAFHQNKTLLGELEKDVDGLNKIGLDSLCLDHLIEGARDTGHWCDECKHVRRSRLNAL
ncbi:hypothetical protein BP5796_13140 [Coleophoma crateriformis]|uniref:Uncharacterized protein n=1 Tax=Coleophoma crateriformis TaxID=565419 RepID=A0A3D8Q3S1_9HELO|nr:hypothetical protein BP5796_13140 [Coleophoma crateriformis]